MSAADPVPSQSEELSTFNLLRQSAPLGLGIYAVSSSLVVLTVLYCAWFLKPGYPWYAYFATYDGVPYTFICRQGYDYYPDKPSMLGYLPGYPLLAKPLTWTLGIPAAVALLIVSHVCLAATFVVLATYVRLRFPEGGRELQLGVLLALGFLPITFCLRLALTEALFLLLILLTFLGIERRWPVPLLALLIGYGSVVRPVGIALVPPFWLHLWRQAGSGRHFLLQVSFWTPVCVWGLAAFGAYCTWVIQEPLVYWRIQRQFIEREVGLPQESKLQALLTLRPFWDNFVPGSRCYWGRLTPEQAPWLCMLLANPIWFGFAILTVAAGTVRGLLNRSEALLAGGLFLIPYVGISQGLCMCSHGRYAAVVFPLYLVLGRLLLAGPRLLGFALLLASTLWLVMYTGSFVLELRYSF